jgi:Cu-Zn family superoxide dismutase
MRKAKVRALTGVATVVATVALLAAVPGEGSYGLRARGEFGPPGGAGVLTAVTYDEELVPAGATITVDQRITGGDSMAVSVTVEGARAGHTFGAHVHTDPCTADPDAAGAHYQNAPGEEPWRANPRNEVWLDFTTDTSGLGAATARQEWVFREGGARSLVLHEHATSSGGHHGETPGDAGERVACFTVPFAGVSGSDDGTVASSEGE